MTWYFSDLARLRSERIGLEQLDVDSDWLVFKGWRIDTRLHLVMDADIIAGSREWPVYLQYPEFFPHTPPSVFPRGDTDRWSGHQYGFGGELCLEYGPDTWTPDLTGVDIMRSAHKLLKGENPSPGEAGTVPSRHAESLGRSLRTEQIRLLLTGEARRALTLVPTGVLIEGSVDYCYHKDATVHVLHTIALPAEPGWSNPAVPPQLTEEYFSRKIHILRLGEDDPLPPQTTAAEFRAVFPHQLPADSACVLILCGEAMQYSWLWGEGLTDVAIIPAETPARRTDVTRDALANKKVALIGCGSLGSKWATMLARGGVGKWVLVDDDVFLPDNVVRNDLDWRDAGSHKARALGRKIKLVNAAADPIIWTMQLGGQVAAASAEAVLSLVGQCDLILDATANPNALNILSAIVTKKKKPVVWAEVFGGGIGGLIARHRPGIDPSPQHMRRAIENWFKDQGAPPVRGVRSYETGAEEAPLIADDADVTVIAANAARFSIDLLTASASRFPHSVYTIGLGAGSVFTEPFDTHPIDVGVPEPEPVPATLSKAEAATEQVRLLALFEPIINETAAAKSDNKAAEA